MTDKTVSACQEERQRMYDLIKKIANYPEVDKKSRLAFTWLVLQMKSEVFKEEHEN